MVMCINTTAPTYAESVCVCVYVYVYVYICVYMCIYVYVYVYIYIYIYQPTLGHCSPLLVVVRALSLSMM